MERPLLSVIVPVYNRQTYLAECLESIVGQTYSHLEIICIDDGSQDYSPNILKHFAAWDDRIRIISQENRGIAATRNVGLAAVSGEWLTWVDSDDWLEPDTYEKAMAVADSSVDMVCFSAVIEGDVESELKENLHRRTGLRRSGVVEMNSAVASELDGYVWNKLIRRNLITTHDITFPVGRIFEDITFLCCSYPWMRRCYFLPERLYHYRQHEASILGGVRRLDPKAVDHLHVVRFLAAYYRKHSIGGEWEDFLYRQYYIHYKYAIGSAPPHLWEEIGRIGEEIAEEWGIEDTDYVPCCPFLQRPRQARWLSVFRSFTDNSVSFGVGKYHLVSVVYHRRRKDVYVMGKRLFSLIHQALHPFS